MYKVLAIRIAHATTIQCIYRGHQVRKNVEAKKRLAFLDPPQRTLSSFAWGVWDGIGDILNCVTYPFVNYLWPPLHKGTTIPPGPKGHFLLGNVVDFSGTDPYTFYNRVWTTYHYLSPVINIPMFTQNNYLVTDPLIVRKVLQSPQRFCRASAFDTTRLFVGDSVITSEGSIHAQKRNELLRFLHQGIVPDYIEIMQTSAKLLHNDWKKKLRTQKPINISDDMMQIALTIMCQSLLGTTSPSQSAALKEPLSVILDFVSTSIASPGFHLLGRHYLKIPTPANREFLKQVLIMEETIKQLLQQTNLRASTPTYLSQQTKKHGMNQEHPEPSRELIQDLLTVFIAGHETTAQSLCFLLEEIAFSQDIQSQLVSEIETILGDKVPTPELLNRMPYLSQVIETNFLRNPSIYISARDVMKSSLMTDSKGDRYHFEKGSRVLISPYLIHQDPRNWPGTRFDPSLFKESVERGNLPSESCKDFRVATFFGGKHRCPGRFFTRQEMKVLLIELLRHFRLDPEGPRALREMIGTLRPKSPIYLNVSLRKATSSLQTKKTQ